MHTYCLCCSVVQCVGPCPSEASCKHTLQCSLLSCFTPETNDFPKIPWCSSLLHFTTYDHSHISHSHPIYTGDCAVTMLQEAKAKAKEAKQAKAVVSWQMTMASKVADLLRRVVSRALDKPPAGTPGHSHTLPLPCTTLHACWKIHLLRPSACKAPRVLVSGLSSRRSTRVTRQHLVVASHCMCAGASPPGHV